ncbi:VOC family protein [Fictibacillus barbaricus]|uniref:VOC family protein n=1 Tax=Fictibacillus barbaricus TaxID=182136 RepID=A0ABS2ZCW7_9BACL|nr:VOC family protein [Fictibacillus barbaricus]MBN3545532.1 VOC family protein [Fictibacillus barbaricus]GGB54156.1 VOC family protein [Fictibacillus barbaricus]
MIVAVNPYVVTNGNGQEAVKFYEKALNAEVISMQTFGDMPEDPNHPIPSEAKDRVMNAQFKVGDTIMMLSDTFPGMPYNLGSQVNIAIHIDTVEDAKNVFEKLSEGGKVGMPLQETFWSPSYGQVTDKYGVEWQISTIKQD